jgi:inner membrane protein
VLGRTHLVIGLTTLATLESLAGFIEPHLVKGIPTGLALCAGAAMLGALLPDLDAEESEIKGVLGLVGSITTTLIQTIGVSHRGLTHYGLTTILVGGVATLLGWRLGYGDVGLALGLGYASHVLADAMTLAGVPLLWPLSEKFHLLPRPLRLRTGSAVERLVLIGLLVALSFLLPSLVPAEWVRLLRRWLG